MAALEARSHVPLFSASSYYPIYIWRWSLHDTQPNSIDLSLPTTHTVPISLESKWPSRAAGRPCSSSHWWCWRRRRRHCRRRPHTAATTTATSGAPTASRTPTATRCALRPALPTPLPVTPTTPRLDHITHSPAPHARRRIIHLLLVNFFIHFSVIESIPSLTNNSLIHVVV
jgi:hypothetical protein